MPRPAPQSAAIAYLASRTRLGVKFGLDTIARLVEALGHPERAYATLLVAGTNGKGSVVAYADAVLRASGLKVGRYTSPHLVRVHERIAVNGQQIGEAALDSTVARVREEAEHLARQKLIPAHPTYFEALTAAAFEQFRREAVDVAVLEVGMGGRLDATNVSDPLASAIVSVDRDHEAYLGSTLPAIAHEKAGVLRRGRVTVLGSLASEARDAVAKAAAACEARFVDAAAGSEISVHADVVDIVTPVGQYRGLHPLAGAHQRSNLVVALRLLEVARDAGLPVALDAVGPAIARTRWPGRLEWLPGDPPLLLDGAHNPAGARALADHLRSVGPFVLLFGVMADKDVSEMTRLLFPLAQAVVLTRPSVARAATPESIVARANGLADSAHCQSDPRKALALARRLSARGHPVVVAGSLYLVGDVMKLLKRGA